MLIRDVMSDDLARLAEINAANVPEVGSVNDDRLAFIVNESAIALVVEVDTEIAGFCLVLPPGSTYDSANYSWFMERYDDAMYLDRVAFDKRFHGRGLGQILYAAVAERICLHHPDIARLSLEINADPPNESSLRFHARQGFREVGRQTSNDIEASMQVREM